MTLNGIDISHYQSGLSIAKADVDFALMKATEGTSYVDSTCDGFVTQAVKANVLYGVYHFAHTGSDAEADHFIQATKGYHGKGILALDWEADAISHGVSAAKNWLDRVYEKTGIRAIVYMSQSVANGHDWSSVSKNHALWVARYNDEIGSTGGWPVTMWQYTSSGKVNGYSGSVDKNHFYGDRAAWAALAASSSSSGGSTGKNSAGGDSKRGPSEALSWAKDKVGTTGYGGYCLQFTREAYGIPSKYPDAATAWDEGIGRHGTSSTSGIPKGLPIFFDSPSSSYGHVAVYAGDGKMITTHASTNKIGQDSVSTWINDYGYKLLGWAETLNGVRICTDCGGSSSGGDDKPSKKTVPDVSVDGVWGSGTIKQRQVLLWNLGLYDGKIDGKFDHQNPYWKSRNPGLTSGWGWDSNYKGKGGSSTIRADQNRLKKKGLYKGTVDGLAGSEYFEAIQREQQTPVDGVVSHPSTMVKAMQKDGNAGKIA